MKKILLILLTLNVLASCCSIKNAPANRVSEAMTNALNEDGTVFIKSWGVGNKLNAGKEDARRNAVKDAVFKGIPGSSIKRPLVSNPATRASHAAYFEKFFSTNGAYIQYVKETSYDAKDVIKAGCYYKVGVKSRVYYLALQKELENAGIIEKFGL